jgi:hypothetical protein
MESAALVAHFRDEDIVAKVRRCMVLPPVRCPLPARAYPSEGRTEGFGVVANAAAFGTVNALLHPPDKAVNPDHA